jgi:hypothetical protein
MFVNEIQLPSEPPNALIESKQEILCQLGHDLTGIDKWHLSAVYAYCLYLYADSDHPTWDYCLGASQYEITNKVQILLYS